MKTAALFVLAALGLAACGGSSDPAPQEPPRTPITGDWMCYLPGHLDDPYAFQAGYGVHVSLQTAREFWTTVQPSGTYEGSWDGGGVGDWGYLRGDWDGTSITMQERSSVSGLPVGAIYSGTYAPGARTFAIDALSSFLGFYLTSETMLTCRKYAG